DGCPGCDAEARATGVAHKLFRGCAGDGPGLERTRRDALPYGPRWRVRCLPSRVSGSESVYCRSPRCGRLAASRSLVVGMAQFGESAAPGRVSDTMMFVREARGDE